MNVLSLDVSSLHDARQQLADAVESFGHVDVLVNCAGITHTATLVDTPSERFQVSLWLWFVLPFLFLLLSDWPMTLSHDSLLAYLPDVLQCFSKTLQQHSKSRSRILSNQISMHGEAHMHASHHKWTWLVTIYIRFLNWHCKDLEKTRCCTSVTCHFCIWPMRKGKLHVHHLLVCQWSGITLNVHCEIVYLLPVKQWSTIVYSPLGSSYLNAMCMTL